MITTHNPMTLLSADRKIKVEFCNLGEGVCGEFDETDPHDVNLLRFDVFVREGGQWKDPGDASYCTQMAAETDPVILKCALEFIMSEVQDAFRAGGRIKKVCEHLSWISPEWFEDRGMPPRETKVRQVRSAKKQ